MSQYALPDGVASSAGVVDRDGVRLSYAVSGDGPVTVLLLPTWSIIPSRFWKLQVPYLSRHYRVVTFDGRGSGDSGRPAGAHAYGNAEYAADALAVLDATGPGRAVVVGLSCAGSWSVHLAAEHPERVSGIVALSPACGFDIPNQHRDSFAWDERLDTTEGWASSISIDRTWAKVTPSASQSRPKACASVGARSPAMGEGKVRSSMTTGHHAAGRWPTSLTRLS